nr:cellulose binding domain-containing protein [Micromonospora sp. DSM 115978]
MRYLAKVAIFLAATLATVVMAAPTSAASATEGGLCDVTATVTAQWNNGYTVSVTVRNVSDRPVTWYAVLPVPPPGYIIQVWNAVVTQNGSSLYIYPPPYGTAGTLLPGQSYTFGYAGTGSPVYPTVTCS